MKKKVFALLLSTMMVLTSGCGEQDNTPQTPDTGSEKVAGQETGKLSEPAVFDGKIDIGNADMFTDRDYRMDYDEKEAILIQLNGDSATCSSRAVAISDSTIRIQEEGIYVLRGSLDNGMIIVDADNSDKVQLVLEEVTICSETSAPIYVMQADKVFVTLAEGTTNTLSNGGSFRAIDENNIDAVIFSKEDLTLNGLGSLQITSPAGHGIISKDDLVITGGAFTIECASHGLDANDSIRLINAAFNIVSGKDGIHAENNEDANAGYVYIESGAFNIDAAGDAISAGAYLQVEDGSFYILSGGGSTNATKEHAENGGMFGGGKGGQGMDFGQGGRNPRQDKGMKPDVDMEQGGMQPNPDMRQNGMEPGQDMKPGDMNFDSNMEFEAQDTASTDTDSTSMKGMKSAGDLIVNGGSFTINSADDAVHANASVTMQGGEFQIATGDDGFHADETLTVNAGNINITESYEGLEGLHIVVNGGEIKLAATDDGINAAGGMDQSGMGGFRGNDKFGGFSGSSDGSIQINGGNLYIKASGDGIDTNGYLEITGGTTIVCGPTRGDTAVLDYDSSATITGGTFIGTGSTQMAQTFSDSTQGVIVVNAGNYSAGSILILTDKSGNTILSREPELDFALVIISGPDIVKGETYTMTIGNDSKELEAD